MTKRVLIGLAGHARSGKDTVADRLVEAHGFEKVAIAGALRRMLYRSNTTIRQYVEIHGWDGYKATIFGRQMLQRLGEAVRKEFGLPKQKKRGI